MLPLDETSQEYLSRDRKVALITGRYIDAALSILIFNCCEGITGQDGSYLTELLLSKGNTDKSKTLF
jgi:hypothetical protein